MPASRLSRPEHHALRAVQRGEVRWDPHLHGYVGFEHAAIHDAVRAGRARLARVDRREPVVLTELGDAALRAEDAALAAEIRDQGDGDYVRGPGA